VSRPIGPNVKKLIAARMSVLAIPPRSSNPLAAGIALLSNPAALASAGKQATAEILASIDAVKAAPDNTLGTDDEVIAAELLRRADIPRKP
jgi:hypothetical protein